MRKLFKSDKKSHNESYNETNTVSITQAVDMLDWTIPRLHRNVRKHVLESVRIKQSRFHRITVQSLIKLLKKELNALTKRTSAVKNALIELQTMLDKDYEENEVQFSPKYDVEKFSYLSDPRNAELRCDQRREA